MKSRNQNFLTICTLTLCVLGAGQTFAQDTWDGGAGTGNWADANNWVDNTAPTTGILNFGGLTQTTTNNNISSGPFGSINFTNNGTTGQTGAFILNGNTITLGGDITSTGIATGGIGLTSTIDMDIVLNANRQIMTNGGASILVLHNITVSGDISDGGSGFGIFKGGTGTSGNLTLSGSNTYTGVTHLANGTTFVTHIADSGVSNIGYGALRFGNLASGGGLTYSGSGSITSRRVQIGSGNGNSNGTIASSGTGALVFNATNFTQDSPTAGTGTRTLVLRGTNTSNNTISGIIGNVNGNALSISKQDNGRWILSNSSSNYTGSTTITGGSLQVTKLSNGLADSSIGASSNAASNLVFNGGSLVYTGTGDSTDRLFTYNSPFNNGGFQINSSGSGALNFTNTGALVQTGTNTHNRFFMFTGTNVNDNTYAGTIGVSGGTGTVNVSKGGSAKWVFTGASSYTGSTFLHGGALEIKSGAGNLTYSVGSLGTSVGDATLIANKSGAGTLAINFTGYSRGAGGTANIVSTGGTNGTDNTLTFGTGAQGFIDKGLFFGGSNYAARNAANTYARALAYGSDPSAAAINTVTGSNHVKLTASHTPATSIALLSLNLAGDGVNWNTGFGINLDTPAILKAGGGSSVISGAGALGNTGAELVIRTDTATDSLTISTNLTGAGGLTKTGKGTLTLNTGTFSPYTGATHVNEGTLSIGMNRHLGSEATGATLSLKGGTLQATGTFGLYNGSAGANNRAVVLTDQSGIEVTGSNTLTIAGVISSNASASTTVLHGFNKLGSGTLELSNSANTYTGATNVNDGKLVVNGNISTSSLTTVAVGATLGGTGTVGKTIINGTLAVGNSPGQMNFNDTLGLNGTAVMEIDGMAGAGVTGGHDFTNLTGLGAAGVLTYGGTMTLDIGMIFGVGNYSWNLFDMATETGTFATITLADQYSGSLLDGDANGIWDLSSGSNTWQFTESTGVLGLAVVPEPTTILLGGLGVLTLLRRRRA